MIRIDKLTINNLRQHELIEVEFPENFTGIIGPIGSGKSSIGAAVSGVLIGDFQRKKIDTLRAGAKTGSVKAEGHMGGLPFTIVRYIHTSHAHMMLGDQEFTGAETVTDQVVKMSGCDLSFLQNMAFVEQSEMLATLFSKPAERKKLLQKFFGLEKATRIHAAIANWKANLPEVIVFNKQSVVSSIKRIEEKIASTRPRIKELEKELQEVSDELDEESPMYDKIYGLYQKAIAYEESLSSGSEEKISILRNNINNIQNELTNLEAIILKTEGEKQNIELEMATIKSDIKGKTREEKVIDSAIVIYNGSKDKACCPLCKSPLKEEHVNELLDSREKYRTELKDLDCLLSEQVDKSQSLLSELRKQRDKRDHLRTLLKDKSNEMSAISKKVAGVRPPKRDKKEYKEFLDYIDGLNERSIQLKTDIRSLNETITEDEHTLSSYSAELAEIESSQQNATILQIHKKNVDTIQSIFAPDSSITEKYVFEKIESMCDKINEYLEIFDSKYYIKMGKGLDFMFCRSNGEVIPADWGSGGEKVSLSLAFRFATFDRYAANGGIMVLDEPTLWLDKKTKEKLADVFDKIKETSKSMGLQTILITHEEALKRCFDDTIELT